MAEALLQADDLDLDLVRPMDPRLDPAVGRFHPDLHRVLGRAPSTEG
ncbi:MAG: hypothetical protein HYZ53_03800 [Planctomycetes bacterium]|nr:hypothetical protein [Planctomycetota bacterium]